MKTTRLLLLRHAETAAPDRCHGAESDIGLGDRGFRQAEAVARRLAREVPSAVISSAMLRARQTAEAVARRCGVEVAVEPLLHERKMGPLSGLTRGEGLPSYAEAKTRWMAGELDFTHEGGESFAEICSRVVPVLERLAEQWEEQTVVVVAHGVVIRVALSTLLPDRGPGWFERFAIDNTGVNDLLRSEGVWSVSALNAREHLDGETDGFVW